MQRSAPYSRTIPPAWILAAFCLLLVLFLFPACGKKNASTGSAAGMVNYTGTFVPFGSTDTSKATGSVTASFNQTTLVLTYYISWNSLTSLPIAMHFHDNGPVIVMITGFPVALSGSISGTCTLTSEQATDLANGGIYAMIHTINYNSGEIYATLVRH